MFRWMIFATVFALGASEASPAQATNPVNTSKPLAQDVARLQIRVGDESFRPLTIHAEASSSSNNDGRKRFFHTPLLLVEAGPERGEDGLPAWVYSRIAPTSDEREGVIVRLRATTEDCIDACQSAVLFVKNDTTANDIHIVQWPVVNATATLFDRFSPKKPLASGELLAGQGAENWEILLRFEEGIDPSNVYGLPADRAWLAVTYSYEGADNTGASVRIDGDIQVSSVLSDTLEAGQRSGSADNPIFLKDVQEAKDGIRSLIKAKFVTDDVTLLPYLQPFADKATEGVFELQRTVADFESDPSLTDQARARVAEYANATEVTLREKSRQYDETTDMDQSKRTVQLEAKGSFPTAKVTIEDLDKTERKSGVEFTQDSETKLYKPKNIKIYSVADGEKVVSLRNVADVVLTKPAGVYFARPQIVRLDSEVVGAVTFGGSFELYHCDPCDARGFQACTNCDGHGDLPCKVCKGKALVKGTLKLPSFSKLSCRVCGGDGDIANKGGVFNAVGGRVQPPGFEQRRNNHWISVQTSVCIYCSGTGYGAVKPSTVDVQQLLPCGNASCRAGYELCGFQTAPPSDGFRRCRDGIRTCMTCGGTGRRKGTVAGGPPPPPEG